MTNIVMLVKDRLNLTTQAIVSLYTHTKEKDFTLTLVDNGSTDFRVSKFLRLWVADHSNCALVTLTGSGNVLAQCKNLGVATSREIFGEGDYLHLSDNDVYFLPDWLSKLTAFAHDSFGSGYRLWGGQVHPFHLPIGSIGYAWEVATPLGTTHDVLDGPSWLMHWSTWNDYGPLSRDTAPGPCQSEEYPFCKRLLEHGLRIGVITPHVVIHTGLTQTDGKRAPGYDERKAHMIPGVIYE